MKIGKYRIYFTGYYWLQTYAPMKSRKFLFMTIYWEANPADVDKKQEFPLSTPMIKEGRTYRYFKA